MRKILIFGFLLFLNKPLFATGLITAYNDALTHDPKYQQAVANFLANKQAPHVALARLLPQINASADYFEKKQTVAEGNKRFDVQSYNLSLKQEIFNWTDFKNLSSANATAKQAFANLKAENQDLIIRVASAYFRILEAKDILKYTKQREKSVYNQFTAIKIRYHHRDATITDLEQAKASYQLIHSQVYTSKINLNNRIQELSQITGKEYAVFAPIQSPFPILKPKPNNLAQWLVSAKHYNFTLIAARFGIKAAKETLNSQYGEFLPTADLIGNYNENNEPFFIGNNPHIRSKFIGVNINLPIFVGGLRPAQVKIAKAELINANALSEQAYLNATANTRRYFYAVEQGASEVNINKKAINTYRSALQHTQEGYIAGTQTVLDILEIERQLFIARSSYSRNLYAYLINTLLLKEAAGNLKYTDLASISPQ